MTDNNTPSVPPAGSNQPYGQGQQAPQYGAPQYNAPQQAPQYGAPAYGQPGQQSQKWNVLSIVSIAGAVLGFNIIAAILGFIALNQIKKTGEQGRVLAIIAIVLGILSLVIIIIGIVLFFAALGTAGSINYDNL
ncbi:DUF4190 domain-containing protein [Mycetocola manganoxydans]|uniref:DUF4190 domain-containing protein n=1 Tax=Mycetocola manganoxydans TaxID=699879 RepID=A0A3L6ZUF8_9MICO|nr:DUF4190 domain-containing protein [Mycetocola manganoxydans]RLP71449.1 DUF4190 domain-containing protein [Mycetocola manganoxydans]GHD46564.1 hypothetical protein GCM10008097_16670 [Mycetocola manganoxydans]